MGGVTTTGFLNKTFRNIKRVWREIAASEYDAEKATLRPDLPRNDAKKLLRQMHSCLENLGGEVSARARAAALGQVYLALDPIGRKRFLKVVAENFNVDKNTVLNFADQLLKTTNDLDWKNAKINIRRALEPSWIRLLTQFNALPDGIKFLVDMRAELLDFVKIDTVFAELEADLKSLLSTWFYVDFLELRLITWENTPAATLEKLIDYEAVHAIESWNDMKNRLESDRRCFAYFHPRMPEEPIIFVEVALVDGIAENISDLLDEKAPIIDPTSANTAIFYSISNAQKGLKGISFGNFLIKRVVGQLSSELPNLKLFSTLSPIPGFRKWCDVERIEQSKFLESSISNSQETRIELLKLAAHYLTEVKGLNKEAFDRVAHFHLYNGARIEQINWMADQSPRGLKQSAGMMVNYVYDLDIIEDNHEAYTTNGTIAVSNNVKGLLT